jgi:hypothetical protein
MHMTINQPWSQPATLQIAFLVSLVAVTERAHTGDAAISDSNISWITFAATHINELGIA